MSKINNNILVLFFIIISIFIGFYYFKNTKEISEKSAEIEEFQCPEYYENETKEDEALNSWIEQYQNLNPEATTKDLLRARVDFLIDNSCRDSLAKYMRYIKSDETAKEDIVQAYISEFSNYIEKEQDYSLQEPNQ